MGFIIKVLITALAVYIAARFIPGVHITDLKTTLVVALILALLNTFIKPILVILTIPISILTLGLFLLVLNALMVRWAADIVHHFKVGSGFYVDGWWPALLVSLVITVVMYIMEGLVSRS